MINLYKLYTFIFQVGFDDEDLRYISNLLKSKNIITVFDVGCYIGLFSKGISEIFRKKNINFHLFDPTTIADVKNNKKHFFTYNKVAISNVNSVKDFYINSFFPSSGSSLLNITKKDFFWNLSRKLLCLNLYGKYLKKKVTTMTLDKYCTKNKIKNIDILKIDVEGCEFLVLQGAQSILSKTKVILLEILDHKNIFQSKEKKIIQMLKKKNFKLIKKKRIWSVSIFSSLKCYDLIFLNN